MSMIETARAEITAVPTIAQLDECRQYLAERAVRPDFVMVEIGHGGVPVAYQQSEWQGGRRYFGVEAWLEDEGHERRNHLQGLLDRHPVSPNIQFLALELGGRLQRDEEQAEQEAVDSWYVGAYDARVPLPDGVADEVFLGNVIGDSHEADNVDRAGLVLAEARRLIGHNGRIVIRETISPIQGARNLTDEAITNAGLRSVARLHWGNKLWPQLEELYNGQTTTWFPRKENFYQFLAAAAT